MMRTWVYAGVSLALAAFFVAGSYGLEPQGNKAAKETHPVRVAEGRLPAPPAQIEGTVAQILKAGRYIYLELNTGTGTVWVAAIEEPVAKGDRVSCVSETLMENFESPSLKRKFERVHFTARLAIHRTPGSMPTNHPPSDVAQTGHGARPPADAADMKVDVPPAEGGVTIAELAVKGQVLADKEVILRAKVTKYNADIMDANWLHVRDGSAKRDLVVTTKAEVKVGDTVIVKGRLERDVDLGHGYRYDLIIRNATVIAEKATGM